MISMAGAAGPAARAALGAAHGSVARIGAAHAGVVAHAGAAHAGAAHGAPTGAEPPVTVLSFYGQPWWMICSRSS